MPQFQRLFPPPATETEPFWEACRRHELLVPRCSVCGAFRFSPPATCPRCWSPHLEWARATGRGKLYSYVISHPAPAETQVLPTIIAVVELEEGMRLMTFLREITADLAQLAIGMPLEVVFEDLDDVTTLPAFRPAASR